MIAHILALMLAAGPAEQPPLIEADIIEALKETSFKQPGYEQWEDEARLAFIMGQCDHSISLSDRWAYERRLATIENDRMRGYVTAAYDYGKKKRVLIEGETNPKSIVGANRNVCSVILPWAVEKVNKSTPDNGERG